VNFGVGAVAGAWTYMIANKCNDFDLTDFLLASAGGGFAGMFAPTTSVSRITMVMVPAGWQHVANGVKGVPASYYDCPKDKKPECE
jgi:hypothetical protein